MQFERTLLVATGALIQQRQPASITGLWAWAKAEVGVRWALPETWLQWMEPASLMAQNQHARAAALSVSSLFNF
jgi:hypothetical protein